MRLRLRAAHRPRHPAHRSLRLRKVLARRPRRSARCCSLDDFYKDGDDPTLPAAAATAPASTGTRRCPGTRTPRWPRSGRCAAAAPTERPGLRHRLQLRDRLAAASTSAARRCSSPRASSPPRSSGAAGSWGCWRTRSACAGARRDDVRRRLRARSARGPQVGAVPAAPRLAADARRARASWPGRRRWAPCRAARRRGPADRGSDAAPSPRRASGRARCGPAGPRTRLRPAVTRRGRRTMKEPRTARSPVRPAVPLPRSPFPRRAPLPPVALRRPARRRTRSSSRPKLSASSSRSRRSERQMLLFTVPTLMSRMSAISGSVRPS